MNKFAHYATCAAVIITIDAIIAFPIAYGIHCIARAVFNF